MRSVLLCNQKSRGVRLGVQTKSKYTWAVFRPPVEVDSVKKINEFHIEIYVYSSVLFHFFFFQLKGPNKDRLHTTH